jgi:hypothetical protein
VDARRATLCPMLEDTLRETLQRRRHAEAATLGEWVLDDDMTRYVTLLQRRQAQREALVLLAEPQHFDDRLAEEIDASIEQAGARTPSSLETAVAGEPLKLDVAASLVEGLEVLRVQRAGIVKLAHLLQAEGVDDALRAVEIPRLPADDDLLELLSAVLDADEEALLLIARRYDELAA